MIEKAIEKRRKAGIVGEQIDKGNNILVIQREILQLKEEKFAHNKEQISLTIDKRHTQVANYFEECMNSIFNDGAEISNNQDTYDELNSLLDEL